MVLALIQQPGKGLPAERLDILVRVLGPLHPQDLDLDARLLQDGDGTLGRRDPRPIAVVGDDRLLGKPGQKLGVVRGQGGAQRGHRAVEARLVQRDGVHVALREDDAPQLGALGDVKGKEVAALVEHHRVR